MNEVKKPCCIFCLKHDGPFNREEHILPESCCNEAIILPPGVVCDPCNQYFSQLDGHFVHHHHGVFHKLHHVLETKKGKPPTMPLEEGQAVRNEDGTFKFSQAVLPGREEDFSMTVLANEIIMSATFRPEPADAKLISRFLAKAGLEILYLKDSEDKQVAFESRFDAVRNYARYGSPSSLFVPFAWLRGPWAEERVFQVTLQWKKNTHLNRLFAHIIVPGSAYLIPLEHLDETWGLETAIKNSNYSIVAEAGPIEAEPIKFKVQWGDSNTAPSSAESTPVTEPVDNTESTEKEAQNEDE